MLARRFANPQKKMIAVRVAHAAPPASARPSQGSRNGTARYLQGDRKPTARPFWDYAPMHPWCFRDGLKKYNGPVKVIRARNGTGGRKGFGSTSGRLFSRRPVNFGR
jgi:hypothetical protein